MSDSSPAVRQDEQGRGVLDTSRDDRTGHSHMTEAIDITFDFRADTPPGKDPDALSPALRRYHKLLWGRPLPDGRPFALDDSRSIRSRYLHHSSALGEFELNSDAVVPSFTRWKRMRHVVGQLPDAENEAFQTICSTIGGRMLWPARSAGGQQSINVARGWNRQIMDRMDLTLECIRRWYLDEPSPLMVVLDANRAFLELFEDFEGFVEHFLFQDLVTDDLRAVRFFTPFDDFVHHLLPDELSDYLEYRQRSMVFVAARNARILAVATLLN